MTVKVGDYVEIPILVITNLDIAKYIYGKVMRFDKDPDDVKVRLSKPYQGLNTKTVQISDLSVITKEWYDIMTDNWGAQLKEQDPSFGNIKCDHNWIQSGRSFLTDKMWFDCSICKEKKGG